MPSLVLAIFVNVLVHVIMDEINIFFQYYTFDIYVLFALYYSAVPSIHHLFYSEGYH